MGTTRTLPSGNSVGADASFTLSLAPVEGTALVAMPPAAALVPHPPEFLGAQHHGLPNTHPPALPGKGGWTSLLARIQPCQVLGFRGQRKGTFQGSSHFLRTSVPISLVHMIYWDILQVPNVSTSQKTASVGQSRDVLLSWRRLGGWGWGREVPTPRW